MAQLVNCPECRREVRVPDDLHGKLVRCPTCGATFTAGESPSSAGRDLPPMSPSSRGRRRDEYDEDRDDYYDYDDIDSRRRRRSRYRRGDYVPHRGTMILVFGILSVVGILSIIFGPMAWVMGSGDLKEIRAGRMDPEGESQTHTGMVLGIIGTILGIIGILAICCWFAFVFSLIGAAANAR